LHFFYNPTMKTIAKRPNNLIGKGGVGLVMFYLARQGIEFVLTSDRSDQGDMWIDGPGGVLKAEIKTSTKEAWPVRIEQARRVDVFFFVHLLRGECWVLSSECVRSAIRAETRSSDTVTLTIKQIKQFSEGDMSPLVLHPSGGRYRAEVRARAVQLNPESVSTRTVRRKLASGEMKEYRYHRPSQKRPPMTPTAFSLSFSQPVKTDRF
jgi:hypothetical protein